MTVVERFGDKVEMKLQNEMSKLKAAGDLKLTKAACLATLSSEEAKDRLRQLQGASLQALGDPRKTGKPSNWKTGYRNCRHCDGEHMDDECPNRDAKTSGAGGKSKKEKEREKAKKDKDEVSAAEPAKALRTETSRFKSCLMWFLYLRQF